MSEGNGRSKSHPAVAAALILAGAGLLFYLMPIIMLWLGGFSRWLAAGFGIASVLGFFLVFWLRARYQRKQGR